MKTVEVEIRGTSPLLIQRFEDHAEMEKATRRIKAEEQRDPRKEAEKRAYIAADGTYYFSAFAIIGTMRNAGATHKQRGSRKTLKYVVPCAVRMDQDTVTILNGEGPAKSFEVDARPVTIPATKGRVMRYRPRFNCWGAKFRLVVNDELLDPQTAHQLLVEAGQTVGIGDFRPEKCGPFGCFQVTGWKQL